MIQTIKQKFAHFIIKNIRLIPSILGALALFYSILPLRIWGKFVFPNQVENIVVVCYLVFFILITLIFKIFKRSSVRKFALSNFEILLLVYMFYIACHYLQKYKTINPEFFAENFALIVLYISFRNIQSELPSWLLLIFPVAAIAQIFYGIKNQIDYFAPGYGLSDITGIFNNTGIFGGFIAVTIVVTAGLFFKLPKASPSNSYCKSSLCDKILLSITFIILSIQLIASNSRAAWCGCLAGTLYLTTTQFGLCKKFSNLTRIKKWAITVVSISLMAILLFGLYQYKKDSADGRILIWQVSLNMIKDKPFWGHGPGSFKANYMEYQALHFNSNPESSLSYLAGDNTYAFNEFVKIWVEQGSIGLLLIVTLLFFLFFRNKVLNENRIITLSKASLLVLLAFGLFSYPTEVFQFNFISVFFMALIIKYSHTKKYMQFDGFRFLERHEIKYLNELKIGIMTCWLTVALMTTMSITKYVTACKKWDCALKAFNKTNYIQSIETLELVYPQLKNNGIFLITYGKALTLSGQHSRAIPVLLRANCFLSSAANYTELGKNYDAIGDFENAKNVWHKASCMIPSQFTPKYLMVKMLLKNNEITEAQKIALELLQKDIKVWSPDLQEIIDDLKEHFGSIDKTKKMDIFYLK